MPEAGCDGEEMDRGRHQPAEHRRLGSDRVDVEGLGGPLLAPLPNLLFGDEIGPLGEDRAHGAVFVVLHRCPSLGLAGRAALRDESGTDRLRARGKHTSDATPRRLTLVFDSADGSSGSDHIQTTKWWSTVVTDGQQWSTETAA